MSQGLLCMGGRFRACRGWRSPTPLAAVMAGQLCQAIAQQFAAFNNRQEVHQQVPGGQFRG